MAVSANDELYYWGCGGLHDTPPLEAVEVRRQPSPSPPLDIPSPEAISDSSPSPQSYSPSLSDGVLIHFMDGGKNPDIAAYASRVPLAGDDEEDDRHHSNRGATAVNDVEKGMHRPSPAAFAQDAARQSQIVQELAADNAARREVGGEHIDEIRPPISSAASTHASDARRPPFLDTSLKLIDLKKKGMDAGTERFDHIDDHFMGRGCLKKQSILDWTPVDSGKSKVGVEVAHTLNSPSAIKDHSDYDSCGSSSESTVRGDNYRGTKRKLCNNNGGNHQPTKSITGLKYIGESSVSTADRVNNF